MEPMDDGDAYSLSRLRTSPSIIRILPSLLSSHLPIAPLGHGPHHSHLPLSVSLANGRHALPPVVLYATRSSCFKREIHSLQLSIFILKTLKTTTIKPREIPSPPLRQARYTSEHPTMLSRARSPRRRTNLSQDPQYLLHSGEVASLTLNRPNRLPDPAPTPARDDLAPTLQEELEEELAGLGQPLAFLWSDDQAPLLPALAANLMRTVATLDALEMEGEDASNPPTLYGRPASATRTLHLENSQQKLIKVLWLGKELLFPSQLQEYLSSSAVQSKQSDVDFWAFSKQFFSENVTSLAVPGCTVCKGLECFLPPMIAGKILANQVQSKSRISATTLIVCQARRSETPPITGSSLKKTGVKF
ncbi:hypothetical protein B0H11DRAFT_1931438 [Mycena galericulata]|nr:hypothetical protein B0H11DRAFT_1931438 [Mycena galericulata]